jgi:hypothetical protein
MIWEFPIEPDELESRVVEVRFTQDKRSNKHNFVSDIPPLLRTCRSARNFAFKVSVSSVLRCLLQLSRYCIVWREVY